MKHFLTLAALALVGASPALAQTAPTSEALGGPVVPGVCLLSQQAVLTNAKAGLAATARLRELSDQAKAEIEAERAPIAADVKALDAQRASLKPADLQQRQQALSTRARALQEKADLRSREIEATRVKALGKIATEAQPVIASVYKAHNCGLLADRNAMLGGNMANDLTGQVVQGLDAKMSTITFDRETLAAAAPSKATAAR